MNLRILLLSWILFSNLSAVGEAGAIFMLIAPGAGPQGTGEAQVAKADDAFASWYNPAGLGFLKGREAAGMHVQWLPNLADDLFYEFIAYRHEYPGLGTVGGHLIFLNLGEQTATDHVGNELGEFTSWMGAIQTSFGTTLSPNSSIGLGFKIIHQSLTPFGAGTETGEGASTDFAFDIGYLKKFRQSHKAYKSKKAKKINRIFNQFTEYYNRQININEKIYGLQKNESNIYDIVEEQEILLDEMGIQKEKLVSQDTNLKLDEQIITIIYQMEALLDSLDEISIQDNFSSSNGNTIENIITISDKISFAILDIEPLREDMLKDIEKMEILEEYDDKFNFGIAITNIGPPIWFEQEAQADPAPTNMRMGIFAELYNDGNNKLNFLFDMNKLLVARYPAMDWNGDGTITGEKELSHDDPWYVAVFTAWLDDWYLGGDLDLNNDGIIGGFDWDVANDENGIPDYTFDILDQDDDGNPIKIGPTEWYTIENNNATKYHDDPNTAIDSVAVWGEMIETPDEYNPDSPYFGIYNNGDVNNKVEKEKGTGKDRTFKTELEEVIYNIGLEYWYTENFCLRAGYIYDYEGQVMNATFGAGIHLLKYGFDFGYTAGEQGHPRANTMFFSINMEL